LAGLTAKARHAFDLPNTPTTIVALPQSDALVSSHAPIELIEALQQSLGWLGTSSESDEANDGQPGESHQPQDSDPTIFAKH
jgi:hypothetical protein